MEYNMPYQHSIIIGNYNDFNFFPSILLDFKENKYFEMYFQSFIIDGYDETMKAINTKNYLMFKIYDNSKEIAYAYFQKKMYTRMRHFFRRAIVECDLSNTKELVTFDEYLKESLPDLHSKLSDTVVLRKNIPIHYLRYWSTHNHYIAAFHPIGVIMSWLRYFKKIRMFFLIICH